MSADWALHLYDRRMEPPEPEEPSSLLWEPPSEPFDICPDCENPYEPHSSWCPTHPSEGHLAMQAYRAGPEGTPCPVCEGPKPNCTYWCYEGNAEGEPSYRTTSADFQIGGRFYVKGM